MATIDNCPSYPVVWTEGDRLPEIAGVLEGVDLTGYTITLTIQRPDDAVPIVLTKTATIDVAAAGSFHFSWSAGDLVAGLNQLAAIDFVDGAGLKLTPQHFRIDVEGLPA